MVKINIDSKKSQAATEFLVTYGWAILGVLIVIGALAYYGIFDTDKYINEECSFGTQLYCEDYQLVASNRLYFKFRNNFGQDIQITDVDVFYESTNLAYSPALPVAISSGDVMQVAGSINTIFPVNEKVKLRVFVKFRRDLAGSPEHNITGTLIVTAQ